MAALSVLAPPQLGAKHAGKGEFNEPNHAAAVPGVPAYKPVTGLTGQLRSIGADTMEALMNLWIADFQALYPDIKFSMEAKASGTAGPALTGGTADLRPVAREKLPGGEQEFVGQFRYKPL